MYTYNNTTHNAQQCSLLSRSTAWRVRSKTWNIALPAIAEAIKGSKPPSLSFSWNRATITSCDLGIQVKTVKGQFWGNHLGLSKFGGGSAVWISIMVCLSTIFFFCLCTISRLLAQSNEYSKLKLSIYAFVWEPFRACHIFNWFFHLKSFIGDGDDYDGNDGDGDDEVTMMMMIETDISLRSIASLTARYS